MHATTWLPTGWQHPTRVALPTGHHLRPIRASDVDLDLRAVLGSHERLWAMYGGVWGWPPAGLTAEMHRESLALHEAETDRGLSFHYALFDAGETDLMGRLTIEPTRSPPDHGTSQAHDPSRWAEAHAAADISWWVVDWLVGGPIEAALDAFVPQWIATVWPFDQTTYQPARRSPA